MDFKTFEQQRYPSLSSTAVLERLAQAHAAAAYSKWHAKLQFSNRLATPRVLYQLENLRLLLHGEQHDEVWIGETLQLWIQVYDASNQDASTAWEVVLGALLQDVDFVRY